MKKEKEKDDSRATPEFLKKYLYWKRIAAGGWVEYWDTDKMKLVPNKIKH